MCTKFSLCQCGYLYERDWLDIFDNIHNDDACENPTRPLDIAAVASPAGASPNASTTSAVSSATAAADISPAAEAGAKSGVPEGTDTAAADATGAQNSRGIRATIGHMVSTVRLLQPGVAAVWKRVFVVDMLVTVQVRLIAIFTYKVMCMDSTQS